MAAELAYRTLVELFNMSVLRRELAAKHCLEIVRTEREEVLTFAELKKGARDFALWLVEAKGIQLKDKIAILGRNSVDWDVAFWGTILAGAAAVLIDSEEPPEGVKRHLASTDSRLIVVADDYRDANCRRQIRDFTSSRDIGFVEMNGTPFRYLLRNGTFNGAYAGRKNSFSGTETNELLNKVRSSIRADDTAVIACTSGTTGEPREVELSHANLIANVQGVLENIKVTGNDKLGHIIPPYHSFGLTVTKLLCLWVGATNVYTNKYRQIPKLISDKKITIFIGMPALFMAMARKIEEKLAAKKGGNPLYDFLVDRLLGRYLPGLLGKRIIKEQGWQSLRFFLSGAAPLPMWVMKVFRKRGLRLHEGYGITENSPVYGFNTNRRKLGSVGKPIATVLVKIIDEQSHILPPGEKGEIVLGGRCVMKGYYKNSNATDAVIKTDNSGARWLHTGDLGYLDADGYLYITGRKKYLIVLPSGKNVNPELVESELSAARYVKELLVVGGYQDATAGRGEEAVNAIVRPAWEQIQADTNLSYADLIKQPRLLKNLVWRNINEYQQTSKQLSRFEKVCSHHLQIRIAEFAKTSTGKIKRGLYKKSESC